MAPRPELTAACPARRRRVGLGAGTDPAQRTPDPEEAPVGWTNPETGSDIEVEPDGDFTVTFSMTLPQKDDDDKKED